jgi:hypothetical protein
MKLLRITFLLSLLALCRVTAAGPGKGELTVRPSGQPISSIDIRYNLSQLMGEPTVAAVYRWHSATLKKINPDAVLWLKVSSSNGRSYGFIRVSPTTPDEGEWAFDTTGSPNWDKVIVQSYKNGKAVSYWSAADAKKFWKEGFTVVDATLNFSYSKGKKK